MAAKDRLSVLLAMMDQGVIPVFYDPDVEVCKNVIQACANGGAKCIEFTNRGDFASHVFLEVTRHFAKDDPSVIMGVGSVVDAPDRGDLHRQRREVRRRPAAQCRRRQGLQPPRHPVQPGLRLGDRDRRCAGARVRDREGVPRLVGRRPRLREERAWAPMPWTRIMPTGGVEATEASLRQWFGAGIVACGIGSNLITKKLLDAQGLRGHRGQRAHDRAAREDHQGRPGREAISERGHRPWPS